MKVLVYISQAANGMRSRQVSELASQSMANNRRCGVTGLLLFDGRRFIQAIEGLKDNVDRTMARIRADARHHTISVVVERAVSIRYFADWSLMYQDTAPGADPAQFAAALHRNVAGIPDPTVQAFFIGFAKLGSVRQMSLLDRV